MISEELKWVLTLDHTNLDSGAKKASDAFNLMNNEATRARTGLASTERQMKKTGDVATKAGNKIKSAFMGVTSLIGLGTIFSSVAGSMDGAISRLDTLTNYENVMSNLGIGADQSKISIKMLNKELEGLPTTLNSAVQSVQRFTATNGNIIASTKMFVAMNNAILAGNAPMDQQQTAMEQLSQAYSKGKPDMMEWRAMLTAMPAQLKQVSMAMGLSGIEELGEGLRKGTIPMNDFMATVVQLNQTGTNGFLSFEQQARNSTGGIATSMANVKTAITRGLAEIMGAIGQSNISAFFRGVANAINVATAYAVAFINVMKAVFSTIGSIFGKSKKSVDDTNKSIGSATVSVGGMNNSIGGSSTGLDKVGKSAKKAKKEIEKLTKLGIDELNIIDPADQSDDAGASGVDAGAGGGGIGDMGDLGIAPDIDTSGISLATQLTDKFMKKWGDMVKFVEKNKVPIISTMMAIGAGLATWGIITMLPSLVSFFQTIAGGVGLFKLWTSEMGLVKGSFDLIATAVGTSSLAIAGIIAVVMAVVGALTQLWLTNDEFRLSMITAWNGIKDTLQKIWDNYLGPIFQSITDMLINIWEFGVKPLWDGWVEFVRAVSMAMTEIWTDVLKPFVDFFIVTFGPIISGVFDAVSEAIAFAMSVAGIAIGTTFKNIAVIIDGFVGVIKGLITFITGVFTGDWNKAWEGVKQIFSSIIGTFHGIFQNTWNGIISIFNAGGKIFDGITQGIVSVFKTVVNGLIGGINKVISIPFNAINGTLNMIRDISVLGVAPFKGLWGYSPISVPQLPQFADGNIAFGKVTAQFGEYEGASRDPEVTAPLSKLTKLLPNNNDPEVVSELREQNRLLKQLVDKDTDVYLDADRVNKKLEQKKDRINRQKGNA